MPSLELCPLHQLYCTSLAGSCLQRCHSGTQSSTSSPFPQQQGYAPLLQEGHHGSGDGLGPFSMVHVPRVLPRTSGQLEDAGLAFLLYPFPFMNDESNNLWQFPPLPTPSQILPSPVGHKHIFNELGPSPVPRLSLPLAGLQGSMHAEGVV